MYIYTYKFTIHGKFGYKVGRYVHNVSESWHVNVETEQLVEHF